jgi:hypothetical protein
MAKGHMFALFLTPLLERRGGTDGRVEGDIAGLAVGRARHDIAAALAVGTGARTASGMFAG